MLGYNCSFESILVRLFNLQPLRVENRWRSGTDTQVRFAIIQSRFIQIQYITRITVICKSMHIWALPWSDLVLDSSSVCRPHQHNLQHVIEQSNRSKFKYTRSIDLPNQNCLNVLKYTCRGIKNMNVHGWTFNINLHFSRTWISTLSRVFITLVLSILAGKTKVWTDYSSVQSTVRQKWYSPVWHWWLYQRQS